MIFTTTLKTFFLHQNKLHSTHIDSISKRNISFAKAILSVAILPLLNASVFLAITMSLEPVQASTQDKSTETNLYRSITNESLESTVCDTNRKIIIDACEQNSTVIDQKALSTATGESANAITAKLFSYVERETRKVIDFASSADLNEEDKARALHHFGLLLRPMQDFYLRSNYIERRIEKSDAKHPLTAYGIEPIRLSLVNRGPEILAAQEFEYGDIDKSSKTTKEGAKVFDQANYNSIAKELALKETQRQWNTIEQLIKVKFPQKAPQIIAALKQSKCSANIKFEDY